MNVHLPCLLFHVPWVAEAGMYVSGSYPKVGKYYIESHLIADVFAEDRSMNIF